MLDANRWIEFVHLRDECAEFIIVVNLSLIHQQGKAGASERLGSGSDFEDGLRRVRNLIVKIGRAKALGVNQLSVANDPDGTAGGARLIAFGKEFIDLRSQGFAGILRTRRICSARE